MDAADDAAEQDAYNELSGYSLTHTSPLFVHQHVVDAYAAQHATARDKPIKVAFALMGLYLHLEQGLSGREVQRAHMRLARKSKVWPPFDPPGQRGEITALDVVATPSGNERDRAIDGWCASVWAAWSASHQQIRDLYALGRTAARDS